MREPERGREATAPATNPVGTILASRKNIPAIFTNFTKNF
jgi:hypothetical protein